MGHHDDVMAWEHFAQHWLLVRGIHRWQVVFHKSQQYRALVFSYDLVCHSEQVVQETATLPVILAKSNMHNN